VVRPIDSGSGVIVHINHISLKGKTAKKSQLGELTSLVAGSLVDLVESGQLDSRIAPSLRVHLDWIQYKTNFRDPVIVRRTTDATGRSLPLAEVAIDLRQCQAEMLPRQLADAARLVSPNSAGDGRFYLTEYRPFRDCIIWDFNRLFWRHLGEWEAASGRGFEAALPSGSSDANRPEAVKESVEEFWNLLKELEQKNQLPAELPILEIGVGAGTRAAAFIDLFQEYDAQRGTQYYDRLQFILGDYSPDTLARACASLGRHKDHIVPSPLDALNPFKALPQYRFKVLYVHLTNVYDNLPFDDLIRRDGHLYLVEVRAYFSAASVAKLEADFGIGAADIPWAMKALLAGGPHAVFPPGNEDKGIAFWRAFWEHFRLEERLRALDDRDESHVPPGLTWAHLQDLLDEAPEDVRFHISRGAAESFANTLPLLHPRGYLQVQDIFVEGMDEYRKGFKGPGKLDGSLVVWVNGALLRAVGARAGYDVHFRPFTYRPGSKTSVMYTTQKP
jgi:hypothetical protein